MANSITADEIREQFSQAMLAMYRQEVPQCGTLLELVADVNLAVLGNNPQLHEKMVNADELVRLNVERRGAIRAGTAQEPATLRRMFVIMGTYPVDHYDLSQAGVPVRPTALQPINDASLAHNLFRIFISLLRLELIENKILRQETTEILCQHDIFTLCCRQLLEEHEQQGGFNGTQAQESVQEALETPRWHQSAMVDKETYHVSHNKYRLIVDAVCFPGCRTNHLTPRTLDIGRVQSMVPECRIEPEILVKGPPCCEVPILLRWISFEALEETVLFAGQKQGAYTACFGEIEQRGVVLTPKGR